MTCGMSSRLVQVTVSPTFTVIAAGENVKLSIETFVSAARAVPSCQDDISNATARRRPSLPGLDRRSLDMGSLDMGSLDMGSLDMGSLADLMTVVLQPCSGVS